MIADALALIEFLQKNKAKYDTKSALFNSRGQKIDGNSEIEVEFIRTPNDPKVWFYRVKPVPDYVYMNMPVVSCYTDYGVSRQGNNPSSEYFRYVGNPLSHFSSEPVPNLRVNFAVIGYKPKQLLDKLE